SAPGPRHPSRRTRRRRAKSRGSGDGPAPLPTIVDDLSSEEDGPRAFRRACDGMPLKPSTVGELFERTAPAEVAERLRPVSPEEAPLAPALERGAAEEDRQARAARLASDGHSIAALADPASAYPADRVVGNIENYLGVARIPVGLVGPLRVRGVEASG